MKLYVTETSPYARITRAVIAEKGLVDQVEVILAKTRTENSPYYEINPSGRVPYLVLEDGTAMEDSQLICQWLDQLDGSPKFDPPEGEMGWEHRRLEARARNLVDGISVWTREMVRPENERSPRIIAHERVRAGRVLDWFEGITDHPILAADPPSMPHFLLLTALQLDRRIEAFEWREGRPNLTAWADRVAAYPALRDTLPPVRLV